MQINVSQQLMEQTGSVRNYKVNEIVDIDGSKRVIQGEVSMVRIDRGILVECTLHTVVAVTCSRCLTLFDYPLNLHIEEEYFPTVDVVTGASLPLPDEPGYFTIDEQHVIDLTEAMRQYAMISIPMKPLCYENCAGLCPNCGNNLNQEPCDCPPREIDPRWSGLSKLALAGDVPANEQEGNE